MACIQIYYTCRRLWRCCLGLLPASCGWWVDRILQRLVSPLLVLFLWSIVAWIVWTYFLHICPYTGIQYFSPTTLLGIWLLLNIYYHHISGVFRSPGLVVESCRDLPRQQHHKQQPLQKQQKQGQVAHTSSGTIQVRSAAAAAATTDPTATTDFSLSDFVQRIPQQYLRSPDLFCSECQVPRPKGSWHCRSCGKCILRHSHHCPWLGNCVGLYTMRHFMLFQIYLAWGCLFVLWVALPTVLRNPAPPAGFTEELWSQHRRECILALIWTSVTVLALATNIVMYLPEVLFDEPTIVKKQISIPGGEGIEERAAEDDPPIDLRKMWQNLESHFGEPPAWVERGSLLPSLRIAVTVCLWFMPGATHVRPPSAAAAVRRPLRFANI